MYIYTCIYNVIYIRMYVFQQGPGGPGGARRTGGAPRPTRVAPAPRKEASLSVRKYDHFTPAREMRRDSRALTAHNTPKGSLHPSGFGV